LKVTIAALIALPFFYYRHYVVDKGKFPTHMFDDLLPEGQTELGPKRCGPLPYVAVAGRKGDGLVTTHYCTHRGPRPKGSPAGP